MNDPKHGFTLVQDVGSLAEARGWPSRVLLPGLEQFAFGSNSLPETTIDLLKSAADWNAYREADHRERTVDIGYKHLAQLHSTVRYEMPPVTTFDIPDVMLLGAMGLTVTAQQEALLGPFWVHGSRSATLHIAVYGRLSGTSLDGTTLSLLDVFQRNYAHWVLDALPRVVATMFDDPDLRVLIAPDAPPYNRESLNLLGISDERILAAVSGTNTHVKQIRLVQVAHNILRIRSEYLVELRWRLFNAAGIQQRQPGTRNIYISREGNTRALVNESELHPILRAHDFEIIRAQDLSFVEQLRLFSEARIIAGPHGAGLFNAMFMPPGGFVLEIINPHYWYPRLAPITSMIGVQHWHCFGKTTGAQHATRVDPGVFVRTLETALEVQQPFT